MGEIPILAQKKSADWDTIIDRLGCTIDSHHMGISTIQAKVEAIRELVEREWRCDRIKRKHKRRLA